MVALMGASGAGKSTLLDVLAQRKSTGTTAGDITYNGTTEMVPFAYVMQDDVHIGTLTVRESVYFAAELRLSMHMSAAAKATRVEKIIDMLGLRKVADSQLGSQTVRGVSGGELKRVSIAVEIVHLPGLMFLDEPTTGLDSSISHEVMSAVRNLANQNRTVVCTIHQPSEDTFALFDTLLLLAEGRVVYFGSAQAATDFFTQSPFRFACNPSANPADFIVAVAGSFLPAVDGRFISGGELHTYYNSTEQARHAALPVPPSSTSTSTTTTGSSTAPDTVDALPTTVAVTPTSSFWHQLKTLMHRRWLCMRREYGLVLAPLVA
jgi:ABC-type multidrug transport system ATPase subunit